MGRLHDTVFITLTNCPIRGTLSATMSILSNLLQTIEDGEILDARIGLHWTAVLARCGGERRLGLAATLHGEHNHTRTPDVPQAGALESLPGRELAQYVLSDRPALASLGLAAVNALLPAPPPPDSEESGERLLVRLGQGRRVALVGHFPFVDVLRQAVGRLDVLELSPGPGDLPAELAPEVLPQADVIAITGMTLSNHTLESLLRLRPPQAVVILIGPSTPPSPVFYDYGVDILAGALVTAIDPVLRSISQGANFHQVRQAGVRLVNWFRPGSPAAPAG